MRIRNEERGSGTRNEDPERGTRIRNEERGSGTRNEDPERGSRTRNEDPERGTRIRKGVRDTLRPCPYSVITLGNEDPPCVHIGAIKPESLRLSKRQHLADFFSWGMKDGTWDVTRGVLIRESGRL